MSTWYGEKDETCPISTGEGGGGLSALPSGSGSLSPPPTPEPEREGVSECTVGTWVGAKVGGGSPTHP